MLRSRSWSRTCSRPCTTRPASGLPRSRSASRSASSPWISPRRTSEKKPQVFINPEIVEESGEKNVHEEGCLSIPEYYEEVERPAEVKVKYLDLDGKAARDRGAPACSRPASSTRSIISTACCSSTTFPSSSATASSRNSPRRRSSASRAIRTKSRAADGVAMPLRLIFMGTPDFAVPTLLELAGQGHDIAAVYTRAAKPGGRRGLELMPSPVEREARRLGLAVLTPASLKSAGRAGGVRGARRGCRGGGRLWPDPAEADPRCAAARLLQPACVAAAALARRRADQSRHHGGRRRDRRHHHEDGRGPRHRRHGDDRARCRSAPT